MRQYEKSLIQRTLATSGNNVAEAARILQAPRRALRETISRFGF
ncbi:helix-turn-helix domain-containing protein [Martelella sp. UBA3392]